MKAKSYIIRTARREAHRAAYATANSGGQEVAAVDMHRVAGDVRGVFAGEKYVSRCHFRKLGRAIERALLAKLGDFVSGKGGRYQRCPHRTRCYVIDADAAFSQVLGEPSCHRCDRVLRGGVVDQMVAAKDFAWPIMNQYIKEIV